MPTKKVASPEQRDDDRVPRSRDPLLGTVAEAAYPREHEDDDDVADQPQPCSRVEPADALPALLVQVEQSGRQQDGKRDPQLVSAGPVEDQHGDDEGPGAITGMPLIQLATRSGRDLRKPDCDIAEIE